MIEIRPAKERGHAKFDWLDTHHTFSFGHYYDANHMGFGPLRVINDDRVKPGKGFAPHPHENMEIITYVLEGVQRRRDVPPFGIIAYEPISLLSPIITY